MQRRNQFVKSNPSNSTNNINTALTNTRINPTDNENTALHSAQFFGGIATLLAMFYHMGSGVADDRSPDSAKYIGVWLFMLTSGSFLVAAGTTFPSEAEAKKHPPVKIPADAATESARNLVKSGEEKLELGATQVLASILILIVDLLYWDYQVKKGNPAESANLLKYIPTLLVAAYLFKNGRDAWKKGGDECDKGDAILYPKSNSSFFNQPTSTAVAVISAPSTSRPGKT